MRAAVYISVLLLAGCGSRSHSRTALEPPPRPRSTNAVFQGALGQLQEPAKYDDSYRKIRYPGGDVPASVGACSDVAVRALRDAGIDMQHAVQTDHRKKAYPFIQQPDTNIDHRRVRNLAVYFQRQFKAAPIDCDPNGWKPGDIVVWKMRNGRDHIGIVSDRAGRSGWPAVIHNMGHVAE